jgi:hypothetical protein
MSATLEPVPDTRRAKADPLPAAAPRRGRGYRRLIRVASVPCDHVYVRHLEPFLNSDQK